jgi:Domain of unknown function (DUF4149)
VRCCLECDRLISTWTGCLRHPLSVVAHKPASCILLPCCCIASRIAARTPLTSCAQADGVRTMLQRAQMAQRPTTRSTAANSAAASQYPQSQDKMGVMLERSPINSTPARLLAVVAAVAVGGVGCAYLPAASVAIAHIMAAGTWLGVNVWTTFFAGLTMFKNLQRQTFGKLQAKLFPLCEFHLPLLTLSSGGLCMANMGGRDVE